MPQLRCALIVAWSLICMLPLSAEAPRLKVSANRRFLVYADGKPFFYLADTGWELFHRLNREEAVEYLDKRAAQRFTVIQAVVLAEFDGLRMPNPYGDLPLHDLDPTRPNEAYFKHVDFCIAAAEKRGLFVGLLPTWGDKVAPKRWGVGPEVFTPANARVYGEFLGQRYRDRPIIWILGGDRNPEKPEQLEVWRAMAAGLRSAIGDRQLITYHPRGGASSATWLHDEPWLDFNMMQNGHGADVPVWDRIQRDYLRTPTKPIMDGEPLYEDHPIAFKQKENGWSCAADIRKFAYWDLFAGAHGHTYGNHAVWQFYSPKHQPVNDPLFTWREALDRPGANQMRHVRALMESRPMLTRIPDQSLLVSHPMAGGKRIQATRDEQGRYAFIYIPSSREFTVKLEALRGQRLVAWWFDPRTGQATKIDEQPKSATRTFTPPDLGENRDWVLVLDDADAGFGPPGQ